MKKEKGITLIALVITIVVLLILAGVSISMVLGQNGVIKQASNSVIENRKASAQEALEMAWAGCESEYWSEWAKDSSVTRQSIFTPENLNKYLAGKGEVQTDGFSYNQDGTAILTYVSDDNEIPYVAQISSNKINLEKSNETTIEYTEGPAITIEATADSDWTVAESNGTTPNSWINVKLGTLSNEWTNPQIAYYYKVASAGDDTYQLAHEGTETEYNIEHLTRDITYKVKVVVTDTAYKRSSAEATATTYACFVAGTKVKTEEGLKNIEDIKVGEKVYTINLDNNATELKEVTKTMINKADTIYKIKVDGKTIEATPRHEFYIVDKGWVRAYDLEEGDMLFGEKDKLIEKIEIETYDKENLVNVYNLTVDGNHNYLITEYQLLVHNAASPMADSEVVKPNGIN